MRRAFSDSPWGLDNLARKSYQLSAGGLFMLAYTARAVLHPKSHQLLDGGLFIPALPGADIWAYPVARYIEPLASLNWAYQLHYYICFRTHLRKAAFADAQSADALRRYLSHACEEHSIGRVRMDAVRDYVDRQAEHHGYAARGCNLRPVRVYLKAS
jgi:hypothetical protein